MALAQLVHDLENFLGRLSPKALFAGDEFKGQPAIVVTEDEIVLMGDKTNVVRVDPNYGVALSGKLSIAATPDQVSFGGGYWRLNPLLLSCIPSTTPTPVPVLVKSMPAFMDAKEHLEDAERFLMAHSNA